MSVLKKYFDYSVNQSSPVQEDSYIVVTVDSEGNQITTVQDIDYLALQSSLGCSADWSLNALMKAGINPSFPIQTGNNTRLDGVSVVEQASSVAESILSEIEEK